MLDNSPRGTIVIEDIEIGMVRSIQKVVTDHDIELFAEVSTDRNPVHLDEEYAQDTIFGGRIAHGMLTAGLVSAVIGEQLPGHGTVYMGQSLKFLAPVRPGDLVLAEVEVTASPAARALTSLMRIIRDTQFVDPSDRGAAAAIGNFDGVHLGHQAVLDLARDAAAEAKAPLGVMTFEPHPRSFFSNDDAPFRLMNATQHWRHCHRATLRKR